ncbi:MAG: ABC transporter substrate-binding protein [Syntrophomonadaceae bacterium]
MAHDVFISYASEDKTVADAICAILEGRNIRCWIAPRDVRPGSIYSEELIDALDSCRLLVLVFSSSSNKSPHVLREVETVVSNGIPILPFRIEDVEPSKAIRYFIGSTHWLDAMTPPMKKHINFLADNVEFLLRPKMAVQDAIDEAVLTAPPELPDEEEPLTASSRFQGLAGFNGAHPSFAKIFGIIMVVLLVLAGAYALSGNFTTIDGGEKTTVLKVGLIAPLSVEDATFSKSILKGFKLALEEVNKKAGSYQIELIETDDKDDPNLSRDAAVKLINESKASVLIGPMSSGCAINVAKVAQDYKIPMITPSATDPEITASASGRNDFVFRTCFTDTYEGQMAARYAQEKLSAKTAVILYEGGYGYWGLFAQGFRDSFTGSKYLSYDSNAVLGKDLINQIGNPDAIYLPGLGDRAGAIADQLRNAGIKSNLLGCSAWEYSTPTLPGTLEGCYYTNYFAYDNPTVKNWVEKYEKHYPGTKADSWAALGYDTGLILIDALSRADSSKPDRIRSAIQNTINLPTVCSSITFGPDGNPVNKDVMVCRIENGKPKYYTVINH